MQASSRSATVARHSQVDSELSLRWRGVARSAILHCPGPRPSREKLPLVLVLHGGGGTALHAREATRFSDKADAEHFAVVYPNATRADETRPARFLSNPPMWADGAGRGHTAGGEVDDVGFIGAVIDEVARMVRIDLDRVYATGFSNGAAMALRAGAELSERLAGVAAVAGTLWTRPHKPARPVSMMYITGTEDTLNPIEGGVYRSHWGKMERKAPLHELLGEWAGWLGCGGSPGITRSEAGVVTWQYGPAPGGGEVRAHIIEGCGHVWPGGRPVLAERWSGPASDKLDATGAIWEFFREKRRG